MVVLPATYLFLLGRDADRLVPRGIAPLARLAASGVRLTLAGVAQGQSVSRSPVGRLAPRRFGRLTRRLLG